MKKEIIIGTRDSQLALWQTNWVLKKLEDLNPDCDFKVRHIKTKGDKILDVPLANIGDKALFTKELEVEMINGNIDLAVHSLKDLPTELPEGLKIGAVCEREKACDVLLSPYNYTFDDLPKGARVGTSSLRRKAQLLYKRPDLKILDLRGNLNTRIKKMESGDYDAIILAAAGVIRMGWEEKITQYLDEDIMLSAVGQGAVAVEIRDNDLDIENIVGKINHRETSLCVYAERSFLAAFEGGCQIPLGAHAKLQDNKLVLNGLVASLDGQRIIKDKIEGVPEKAQNLGNKLAQSFKRRGADRILKRQGNDMDNMKVYLVGAGPGDYKLITLKGKECIEKAEAIIYDRLVNKKLLEYASSDAEIIYAGKSPDRHVLKQEEINELIVKKALEGKTVTRLKGGDPFVFGRGGEEALALIKNNIPFEIVPGITSAIAVPAYAGIPVTHRGITSNVGFITGNEDPTKEDSSIEWDKISTGLGTLVFLMGMKNLPKIVDRLIENGRSPKTPVALIRWGTRAEQETMTGVLEDIVEKVQKNDFKNPAIIIVGEVVNLREKISWFEKKPLFGKKVLVTRARAQAGDFSKKIEELGGSAYEFPVINIVPPDDYTPLDKAIINLREYSWIIFTSVNGVKYFFKRMECHGKDVRGLGNIKIAAIGPATENELKKYGLIVDVVPDNYRAEAIVDVLKYEDLKGKKILLPRADIARKALPEELQKIGAQVNEVSAYKTVSCNEKMDELEEMFINNEIDFVTFTSSSTVSNFVNALSSGKFEIEKLLKNVTLASIGPITSSTAKKHGLKIDIEADEYTLDGLIHKIKNYN